MELKHKKNIMYTISIFKGNGVLCILLDDTSVSILDTRVPVVRNITEYLENCLIHIESNLKLRYKMT